MVAEFLRKAFDVGWLAAHGVSNGGMDWGKILEPGRSNWQRGLDFFQVLHTIAPIVKKIYPNTLFDNQDLPLDRQNLVFIGSGANQVVFAWGNMPGRVAVKVDRKTLCTNVDPFMEAKRAKKSYLQVKSFFGETEGLILPESQLVTEIHANYCLGIKARTSIFLTIQPFQEGTIKDFFRDTREIDLLCKLDSTPRERESKIYQFWQGFF